MNRQPLHRHEGLCFLFRQWTIFTEINRLQTLVRCDPHWLIHCWIVPRLISVVNIWIWSQSIESLFQEDIIPEVNVAYRLFLHLTCFCLRQASLRHVMNQRTFFNFTELNFKILLIPIGYWRSWDRYVLLCNCNRTVTFKYIAHLPKRLYIVRHLDNNRIIFVLGLFNSAVSVVMMCRMGDYVSGLLTGFYLIKCATLLALPCSCLYIFVSL